MKIDVVADKFNDLEKGFFAKLLDRSVLPLAGAFLALQCDEGQLPGCVCTHVFMRTCSDIHVFFFFKLYIYIHINFHYRYRYVYRNIHTHMVYTYIYGLVQKEFSKSKLRFTENNSTSLCDGCGPDFAFLSLLPL